MLVKARVPRVKSVDTGERENRRGMSSQDVARAQEGPSVANAITSQTTPEKL